MPGSQHKRRPTVPRPRLPLHSASESRAERHEESGQLGVGGRGHAAPDLPTANSGRTASPYRGVRVCGVCVGVWALPWAPTFPDAHGTGHLRVADPLHLPGELGWGWVQSLVYSHLQGPPGATSHRGMDGYLTGDGR